MWPPNSRTALPVPFAAGSSNIGSGLSVSGSVRGSYGASTSKLFAMEGAYYAEGRILPVMLAADSPAKTLAAIKVLAIAGSAFFRFSYASAERPQPDNFA